MKMKKYKWGIVAALAVITSIVAATLALIPPPTKAQEPEWKRETKLQVDDVYFLAGEDDNTEDNLIPIITTLYLTNAQWNSSGSVKIVAYILRTNPNIAVDKSTLEVGIIPGSTTKEAGVHVMLPGLNTPYDVDFLIFENDLLVLRGQGNIEVIQIRAGASSYNYVQINESAIFKQVTDKT
ncbi:hypothetical protein ES703_00172 [subsurface metagenome]